MATITVTFGSATFTHEIDDALARNLVMNFMDLDDRSSVGSNTPIAPAPDVAVRRKKYAPRSTRKGTHAAAPPQGTRMWAALDYLVTAGTATAEEIGRALEDKSPASILAPSATARYPLIDRQIERAFVAGPTGGRGRSLALYSLKDPQYVRRLLDKQPDITPVNGYAHDLSDI